MPEAEKHANLVGRRLLWAAACLFSALVILGLVVWLTNRVPSRPDAFATRVPGSDSLYANTGYYWVSASHVIVIDSDSTDRIEAVLLDAKTGRSRVLRRLSLSLSQRIGRDQEDVFYLSPDGRWLLWRLGGAHPCFMIAGIEVGRVVEYAIPPGVEVEGMAWLPDSQRWVALENRRERTVAVVRSVQTLAPLMETPVPGARDDSVLGVSTRDELITLPVFLPGSTNCVVRTLALAEPAARVRTRRFTAPPWTVAIPQLSPDGTRIAWSAGEDGAVTWLDRLRAFMTRARVSSRRGETVVAVSSLDGTDMRPVIRTMDAPGRGPKAGRVAWLPDGKHLSFWYESERGAWGLWVAPVR